MKINTIHCERKGRTEKPFRLAYKDISVLIKVSSSLKERSTF